MKYAVFDENGFPKAFYDKAIHGDNIPAEAIEITEEQWQEFINNQGRRKWDFENKRVVEYTPPPPSFEEVKERANSLRKSKVSSLLSQTDYVLLKLQEAQIEGDTDRYNALLQQYSGVLAQRQAIRQWNDEIEQRIQNASTVEELEQIMEEIRGYDAP